MKTLLELSVIICTHNPRPDYLRQVLNSLSSQTVPREHWELIVVDNASASLVAEKWDISWHPHARHIVEPELGLASARKTGIESARSDVLVFVDDDNVLEANYLAEVIRISKNWPILGVWGSGHITLAFEVRPPKNLEKWMQPRHCTKAQWSNVPSCFEATPWGAGLCVRADVARKYCEYYEQSSIRITDRLGKGKLVCGGGDDEICVVACNLGLGVAVFPELQLTHLESKERVTTAYVLKRLAGDAESSRLLNYKWGKMARSPLSCLGFLYMLRKVALSRGLDRLAYFAAWRGAIRAQRIIDMTRKDADRVARRSLGSKKL